MWTCLGQLLCPLQSHWSTGPVNHTGPVTLLSGCLCYPDILICLPPFLRGGFGVPERPSRNTQVHSSPFVYSRGPLFSSLTHPPTFAVGTWGMGWMLIREPGHDQVHCGVRRPLTPEPCHPRVIWSFMLLFPFGFLTYLSLFLRNKNCHWARIWVPVLSAPALVHHSPVPGEGEEPLPCTGLPLLRRDLQGPRWLVEVSDLWLVCMSTVVMCSWG